MSLRFDNATKYIVRTGVSTPFTICGWLSQVTAAPSGTWNTFLNLRNDTSGSCSYQIDPSQLLSFWDGSVDRTIGSAISIGEWIFWSLTATSTTALTIYTSKASSSTLSSLSLTSATAISTVSTIGAYPYGFYNEKADADISCVKLFNYALTADQIIQEKNRNLPFLNTLSWLSMVDYTSSATQSKDFSGNGNDWTVNGTISVIQSHPPIYYAPSLLLPHKTISTPVYYTSPSMFLAC